MDLVAPAAAFPADAAAIALSAIVAHCDRAARIAHVRGPSHRGRAGSGASAIAGPRWPSLLGHRCRRTTLGRHRDAWRWPRSRLPLHGALPRGLCRLGRTTRLPTRSLWLTDDTRRTILRRTILRRMSRAGLIRSGSLCLSRDRQRGRGQESQCRQPRSGLVKQRHACLPLARLPSAMLLAWPAQWFADLSGWRCAEHFGHATPRQTGRMVTILRPSLRPSPFVVFRIRQTPADSPPPGSNRGDQSRPVMRSSPMLQSALRRNDVTVGTA